MFAQKRAALGADSPLPSVNPSSSRGAQAAYVAAGALAVSALAACGPAPLPPPPPAPTATASAPPPEPAPAATAVATPEPACKEPEGPRPTVVDVTAGWLHRDWLSWPGDASPAVVKACKKLEQRRANLVKKLKDDAAHVADIGRCLPSVKGAWVLDTSGDVQPLKADKEHPDPGWEVRFTLAYVTPAGKLLRSKKHVESVWKRGIEANDWQVLGAFDYDGDGVSELAILHDHHHGDEDRTQTPAMFTWREGEAVPYPNAAFAFDGLVDVDADLRPDLLIAGPFKAEGPCGLEGRIYRGPVQIAHSLPDGRFSTDDAVAKEVVRVQCGRAPAELLSVKREGADVSVEDEASARRITCARIYGVSADDAVKRVRAEYPLPHNADDTEPPGATTCLSLAEMVKLAGQAPPFTMDAPCPAK